MCVCVLTNLTEAHVEAAFAGRVVDGAVVTDGDAVRSPVAIAQGRVALTVPVTPHLSSRIIIVYTCCYRVNTKICICILC